MLYNAISYGSFLLCLAFIQRLYTSCVFGKLELITLAAAIICECFYTKRSTFAECLLEMRQPGEKHSNSWRKETDSERNGELNSNKKKTQRESSNSGIPITIFEKWATSELSATSVESERLDGKMQRLIAILIDGRHSHCARHNVIFIVAAALSKRDSRFSVFFLAARRRLRSTVWARLCLFSNCCAVCFRCSHFNSRHRFLSLNMPACTWICETANKHTGHTPQT